MKLSNFIEGLKTLQPYYKEGDGYEIGAEHDQFYAFQTERALTPDDVQRCAILDGFNRSRRKALSTTRKRAGVHLPECLTMSKPMTISFVPCRGYQINDGQRMIAVVPFTDEQAGRDAALLD